MGACGSANADGGGNFSPEEKAEADNDFRETVRSVLLVVFDRLLTALDAEQDSFQTIARSAGMNMYLDLCAPKAVEKFLRDTFDVKDVPEPDVDRSHMSFEQQQLLNLIRVCQQAAFRVPTLSPKDVTARAQVAVKAVQTALRTGKATTHFPEHKQLLGVFVRALDFLNGDLSSDDALYLAIDRACAD